MQLELLDIDCPGVLGIEWLKLVDIDWLRLLGSELSDCI